MALVIETGNRRDLTEWGIRPGNLRAGSFDAKLTQVLSEGAVITPAKFPCQIDWVHPDGPGQRLERRRVRHFFAQNCASLFQPARRVLICITNLVTRDLGDDLKHQAFDRQYGTGVGLVKLAVESVAKQTDQASAKVSRVFRQAGVLARLLEPAGFDLNAEDTHFSVVKINSMRFVGRMKDDC